MSDDQVESRYPELDALPTLELIHRFNALRLQKEDLETALKAVNGEYDHIRLVLVPERFEEEGIAKMQVKDVGTVSITHDMYVSMKADKKPEAMQYLRDIGKGSIVQESVNSSTLRAVVKEMVKGGDAVPDELFNVHPFARASITKR